jgi:AcrR family transcriptional regulator
VNKSTESNSSRPPRRPQTGGYARGDETRRKIIFAGIKLFGERGFDGASTRDIAAEAGVNAPALQYYFANKEGLFKACAEYLSDAAWAAFEPAILRASAVLREGASAPVLIDTFCRILEAIADQVLGKEALPGQGKFAARVQAGLDPVNGGEIITQRLRHPLNEVSARLMSRITGASPKAPITTLRLLSLHGQNQIFRLANYAAFPSLGWKGLDAEKVGMIKAAIREQTTVLLEHWSKERTLQPRIPKEEIAIRAVRRRPSR